jgi:hypothetical protein
VIPSQVRMTLDITRIPWPPIGSGPFAETSALYPDWFDLTRCEHGFGLGEPRLLGYRHQRPNAAEEPVTVSSANIPVQAAPT